MPELNSNTMLTVARVMADSFMADPLNQYNFAGVKKKRELLYQHSILHTKHAVKTGSLYLMDGSNPRAFLVGVDSERANILSDIIINLSIIVKTLLLLDAQDRKAILSNYKNTRQVVNFN